MESFECDVAVFGSGAAGMAAALVASLHGLKVIVFEKASELGGTTATSGGAVWVPGNSLAEANGQPDNIEDARRLLADELGDFYRADLVDAYLESGKEAIDFLSAHTDIQFDVLPCPDYVSNKSGASQGGRALAPKPFDGSLLGDSFRLVRAPRPAFMILGGLMLGRKEIPLFLRPWASWEAATRVVSLIAGYIRDRLRFSRGTRLLMGNALIARALNSALRLGVQFRTGEALDSLLHETGRVSGALVKGKNGMCKVYARRAVVLATGGFSHSSALRDENSHAFPHKHSLASEENTGAAAHAALRIGAVIDKELVSPGFWTPASKAIDSLGKETLFPYGHLDRGKPGAIIVDRKGRRFVNESDSYHHVVLAMFRQGAHAPHGTAFIVCDSEFIRKYGLGLAKPAPFPPGKHVRDGYLARAKSIAELAAKIGIDPVGLLDEVSRYNGFARAGKDEDFGKGDTAFNRYNGDPLVKPNPCLLPLVQAPFYALEIFPCTLGMAIGLKTDANARVVDAKGEHINGLYACGNDMASFTRGTYPGPGITIGPAMVFAYRAMRHAADYALRAIDVTPAPEIIQPKK
jgi:3-oxosteroid 1-dehydrogenase